MLGTETSHSEHEGGEMGHIQNWESPVPIKGPKNPYALTQDNSRKQISHLRLCVETKSTNKKLDCM